MSIYSCDPNIISYLNDVLFASITESRKTKIVLLSEKNCKVEQEQLLRTCDSSRKNRRAVYQAVKKLPLAGEVTNSNKLHTINWRGAPSQGNSATPRRHVKNPSSKLLWGHANLLCIVPILSDVPKGMKITGAKKALEVGVFTGYSLLYTALTILKDGKIVAIYMDREAYEIGRPVIQKAGQTPFLQFHSVMASPFVDVSTRTRGAASMFSSMHKSRIEADKEIGLEKLDEFPELNSMVWGDWDLPQFFLIVVNAANKELKDRTEICYKDKKNNVTKGTKFVNVEYAWKPPMCAECKVFGHEVGKCKAQKGNKHQCAESNIVDKEGFTNVQKNNKNVRA
ncbi:probable caffeoyl-CoA O-methyltransferase [Tanacetum coccineum]